MRHSVSWCMYTLCNTQLRVFRLFIISNIYHIFIIGTQNPPFSYFDLYDIRFTGTYCYFLFMHNFVLVFYKNNLLSMF